MLGLEHRLNNEVNLSGIFLAKVIENMDPTALERVRVRVLGVHDMDNDVPGNSVWAHHLAYSKAASGEIPDKDDWIYVMFLNNDPMSIVWLGWARVIQE